MLYENIPVVLTKVKQSERTITAGDHLKGVHMVSAKAYISSADMDGVIPEQGTRIEPLSAPREYSHTASRHT